MANVFWTVKEEWPGATVFILASGPSLAEHDLNKLRGQKVITVNSSYEAAPFADVVFFGDNRWYLEHFQRPAFLAITTRPGVRAVTVSKAAPGANLLKLKRITPPPGLTDERNAVCQNRTSLQGAINLAVHLGAKKIVLVGADMGRDKNGRCHWHAPHRWRNKPGNATWDIQLEQLIHVPEALKVRGVECLVVGLESRLPWFPKVATLEEAMT